MGTSSVGSTKFAMKPTFFLILELVSLLLVQYNVNVTSINFYG